MALRNVASLTRNVLQWNLFKTASAFRGLKQIAHQETPDGKIIIEGKFVPSDRVDKLLKLEEPVDHEHEDGKPCYLCRLNLDIKHTDVLILSQFTRSDGRMLPNRITGLCRRQHRRISDMVTMAHNAGLMSSYTPPGINKPRDRRRKIQWNSYWDETTIRW